MQSNLKLTAGVSIIEAMIALTVLSIIGTAVMVMMLQITSAGISAKNKSKAAAYAQQGVEQIRGFVQGPGGGWDILYSSKPGCYTDVSDLYGNWTAGSNCVNPTSCSGGGRISPAESFYRKVNVVQQGANSVRIESNVYWTEKGSCKNTLVTSYLFDN